MNNMPNLSDRFDVDDIRKVRDHNSLRHIKMTPQEIIEETKRGAEEILRLLEEKRIMKV